MDAEKYLGVQKAPGGKKPISKTEKKSGDLFFVCFGNSKKFVGGGTKISRGAPNGNVTPLGIGQKMGVAGATVSRWSWAMKFFVWFQ